MISCFIPGCRWKTTCPSLFGTHLRRVHEPIDVYSCTVSNCGRRFSVRCSYISHVKKHIRNNHDADNLSNEYIVDSEDDLMPSVPDHRLPNENVSIEVPRENSANVEDDQLIQDKNIEAQQLDNLEKISLEISRLSIGFNLKWLNKDTVPRKLVFEFQEDVRSNVLNPISEIVGVMTDAGLISHAGSTVLNSVFSEINIGLIAQR